VNPSAAPPLSTAGKWCFALLFWVAGGLVIALAMDWIHAPPENFHAPRWVVGVAGLVFFAGGFAPLVNASDKNSWGSSTLVLVVVAGMASVFNWVAFGDGPRQFSGGMSLGGIGTPTPVSAAGGRIAFGIGAVILDMILLGILWQFVRRKRS
jgi:hypothetical protein